MKDHESYSSMTQPKKSSSKKGSSSGGMKLESVSMRQAANGGYIVTCNKTSERGSEMPAYEANDYAYESFDDAMAFVKSEFGGDA